MSNVSVMIQLLKHDLIKFKREFFSKLFDTAFLLFTQLIVFGYFMSDYGLGGSYGPFMLISAIASFGFFDIVGKISSLISDIEGDRTISYSLTLPIRSYFVFVYIGIYWAINSALVTIFLFPLGKLVLWNHFDLSQVSYMRLVPIYIMSNLFYGYFSLWITSMLKNIGDLGILWVRVINPIVMFGAYFYAWFAVYKLSGTAAIITLINPMVYVMEGMRAAALGQEGFIPYWISLLAVILFTVGFAWHGIKRLQKRLDCVS